MWVVKNKDKILFSGDLQECKFFVNEYLETKYAGDLILEESNSKSKDKSNKTQKSISDYDRAFPDGFKTIKKK